MGQNISRLADSCRQTHKKFSSQELGIFDLRFAPVDNPGVMEVPRHLFHTFQQIIWQDSRAALIEIKHYSAVQSIQPRKDGVYFKMTILYC